MLSTQVAPSRHGLLSHGSTTKTSKEKGKGELQVLWCILLTVISIVKDSNWARQYLHIIQTKMNWNVCDEWVCSTETSDAMLLPPNPFPYPVLFNVNGASSLGKWTWLGLYSKFEIVCLQTEPRHTICYKTGDGWTGIKIKVTLCCTLAYDKCKALNKNHIQRT